MKTLLAIAVAAAAALLLAVPTAFAMPIDGVTGTSYAAKAFCPSGKQIVYVTQNVIDSADRGVLGNIWALENYQRVISVIQVTPTSFCAASSYVRGSFLTTGGPSPGGTGSTPPGLVGIMGGGWRTVTFTGTLRPFPLEPTYGSFTTDYGCDPTGTCPGYVDWTDYYFSSVQGYQANWFSYAYITPANGTWVQRADTTYGDITG